MCLKRGEWCKIYAEVCNGQEFVTFSVQKPINNSLVAGMEKTKSQGQKRRERRKRMKEKAEKELAETHQEATTPEEVSPDANTIDNVFTESLETIHPESRLRLRSRKIVVSVGDGEAVNKPSNSNKTIEQLDGAIETDAAEDQREIEKETEDDENDLNDGLPETSEHSADAEEFSEFSDETSVDPVDNDEDEDSEKALESWRAFQSFCQTKFNKNEVMKTPNLGDYKTNNLFFNPG
jgi:hypothetical protein